jgi:hypothetical protein
MSLRSISPSTGRLTASFRLSLVHRWQGETRVYLARLHDAEKYKNVYALGPAPVRIATTTWWHLSSVDLYRLYGF